MGIEYRAACTSDDACIDILFDWIARDGRFAVLARYPRQISLRIAKYPLRETWRQDVDVRLDDAGLHVCFHGGTSTDREEFLDVAREALARSGCVAVFEEL